MHLKSLALAALLPLLAAADDTYLTTTLTSTKTATQTITLARVSTYSYYEHSNGTATYKPTDYPNKVPPPTGTSKPVTVPTSGASLMGGAHAALLGVAGVAVAFVL